MHDACTSGIKIAWVRLSLSGLDLIDEKKGNVPTVLLLPPPNTDGVLEHMISSSDSTWATDGLDTLLSGFDESGNTYRGRLRKGTPLRNNRSESRRPLRPDRIDGLLCMLIVQAGLPSALC